MRAVWSWLRELCELPREVSVDEAGAGFTASGLEVERIERLGEGFAGVVIAEVASKRRHPEADRLTVVEVRDAAGGPPTEVVCGAGNVPEPGGRVLWARPGATLPGGIQIGQKKLKGVVSAGMLCSETELGIGDDGDGIVTLAAGEGGALGGAAQDALGLRDAVFELSIAANRPDLLGHLGLARELCARFGGRVRWPDTDLAPFTGGALGDRVAVTLADPAGCPRYTARLVEGLRVGPSPRRIAQRLRAVGVRPLSNLVDVTNYVLFELGQPLHAFDLAQVAGGRIVVRRAAAGERMTTLDGVDRALVEDDLLICDASRPVALAGVMGGRDSEISGTTTAVLLESASFAPIRVRRTARRLGLHSEASHRFERGVDPELSERASARAARLLCELGGGRVAAGVVDVRGAAPTRRTVTLRAGRASLLTGVPLSATACAELLGRLEMSCEVAGDEVIAEVPSFRADVAREVDLIEEVIRIHGYDQVPVTLPTAPVRPSRVRDVRPLVARRALTACGYDEAITFGFTAPGQLRALGFADGDRRGRPLELKNPMTVERSVMRTSLLPGLLAAVADNRKQQLASLRLFEVGSVFLPRGAGELPDEPTWVAGVACGAQPGWLGDGPEVDFFALRGAIDHLVAELGPGVSVRVVADASVPYLHPGVAARLERDGDGGPTVLGVMGEIHPRVRAAFEIEAPCFGFELELGGFPLPPPRQMEAIPRFPAIARDLSFFVAAEVPAARVRDLLLGEGEGWIEAVRVLEDYRDPTRVPAGKKGMLWGITYRSHERTLTDAEVDAEHEKRVARTLQALDAVRR